MMVVIGAGPALSREESLLLAVLRHRLVPRSLL